MPGQLISSADERLIRRLEYGHADSGTAYAKTYLARHPESDVAFEQIGGGWAVFQSPESPVTQALAVGMNGVVTPEELARLIHFFHSRGSAAVIDLSSMADASVLGLLQDRNVVIREISNVLARRIAASDDFASFPFTHLEHVERVGDEEVREWARVVIQGFTEQEQLPEEQIDLFSATPAHLMAYIAMSRGERVAAAAMTAVEGLATFFGDATIQKSRRLGLQLGLIAHRLQQAAEIGCDLASSTVFPGSSSHRNYERAGFQLVYSRIQVAIPL